MRILHIITGLGNGGAESVLFRLISSSQGTHQHGVISLIDEGYYGALLRERGAEVTTLHMNKPLNLLTSASHLKKAVRDFHPDIVQTWMYHANYFGGILTKKVTDAPLIWGLRHANLKNDKWTTKWISHRCSRRSYNLPDKIIYCAYSSADYHLEHGYDPSKTIVIGNGYDLSTLKSDALMRQWMRKEFEIKDDDILIGFIARWDPAKDHQNLLSALQILKRKGMTFKCLLVGPNMSPENSNLVKLIRNTGLSGIVDLAGPRRDIAYILNGLDLHVLSSKNEAFPNVVAESMACGTPCVATDVGDAARIVDRPEWIVPSGAPNQLAEAVIRALKTIEQDGRDVVGEQCRRHIAENFSLDLMIKKYHDTWLDLHEHHP